MEYQYCPADGVHYATDLRWNPETGTLQWNGGRGQDALLVRTPYGGSAAERMDEVCTALSRMELREGQFTRVLPGAEVRLVTPMERARRNGVAMEEAARTYTVFACAAIDGVRRVYAPQRGEISSPRCDVPLRLRVEVSPVEQRRFPLFRANQAAEFYRIAFPQSCGPFYQDGDIAYQVGGFSVPVTKRMFEAGAVYVRTGVPPRMASRRPGLELV